MSQLTPEVIFEDSSILVINKPSHWVTNSADTARDVPILQKWLKETQKYEIAQNDELRSGVVHRLDRETSGILLVAKTPEAMIELQRQFKERIVAKEYVALCHGVFRAPSGEVKATIGRLPWNRERFGVFPGGRDSATAYSVTGVFEGNKTKYSLVDLFPKTGRTHQIRVHMKYLGHPIVSDGFYAGRKTSRNDQLWCPRLFLHAKAITFMSPLSKKEVHFEAELPDDLQMALKSLTRV